MNLKPFIDRYERALRFYNYFVEITDEISEILGNGHTEKVYQKAIEYELNLRRIKFKSDDEMKKDQDFKVMYKGEVLSWVNPDFIILKQRHDDFVLTEPIIIELKTRPDNENISAIDHKIGPRGQLHKYTRAARLIKDEEHYAFGAAYGILINFSWTRLTLSYSPESMNLGETPFVPHLVWENLTELWNYETRVHALTEAELEKYQLDEKMKQPLLNAIDRYERYDLKMQEDLKDLSQEDMDEWLQAAEFIDQDAIMITRKEKPNLTLVKKLDN